MNRQIIVLHVALAFRFSACNATDASLSTTVAAASDGHSYCDTRWKDLKQCSGDYSTCNFSFHAKGSQGGGCCQDAANTNLDCVEYGLGGVADCKGDLGCEARKVACMLAHNMTRDRIPSSKDPKEPELLQDFWNTSSLDADCSPPNTCAPDVVDYESRDPMAKYGMQAGKAMSKGSLDMLKDVLKSFEIIKDFGGITLSFLSTFLNAFFPSALGLPPNPCTFATQGDWGKCVWEQVKPFVQEFVDEKLDQAFEDFWEENFQGFRYQLRFINSTAYGDSELYPNGTIKHMNANTTTQMYNDLHGVHESMIQKIPLFMADHAINTTAGSYLSAFASLHISVMSNLLGSAQYRSKGNRETYQTLTACYAMSVYDRATQALKARMSALVEEKIDERTVPCPSAFDEKEVCDTCKGVFKDTWKNNCSWKGLGYDIQCVGYGYCMSGPTINAIQIAKQCFDQHKSYVHDQTVKFWQSWLEPIPDWLNSVVLMQEMESQPTNLLRKSKRIMSGFECFGLQGDGGKLHK